MDTLLDDNTDDFRRASDKFFKWIMRCDIKGHPEHEGDCTYLGSLEKRLKEYKRMREKPS